MIVRTGLYLALWSQFADALSYYYSYQDALCVDDYTIEGTFVMSFDDPDYATYGFTSDYSGECLYLTEGSQSLYNDDGSTAYVADFDYGSCIECNGVAGCSSDGTCSNFKTYAAPVSSNSYQLSQGGSTNKEEQAAPEFGAVAKEAGESSVCIVAAHHDTSTGEELSEPEPLTFTGRKSSEPEPLTSTGRELSEPESLGLFVSAVGVAGVVGAALVAIMVNRKRNNGANQALKDSILADGVETEHQYAAFA
jgi:hypothetical protein